MRNEEVPALHKAAGASPVAKQVVRPSRLVLAEGVQVVVLHRETIAPVFEEEAHLGDCGGVVEEQGVLDHLIEVEILKMIEWIWRIRQTLMGDCEPF